MVAYGKFSGQNSVNIWCPSFECPVLCCVKTEAELAVLAWTVKTVGMNLVSLGADTDILQFLCICDVTFLFLVLETKTRNEFGWSSVLGFGFGFQLLHLLFAFYYMRTIKMRSRKQGRVIWSVLFWSDGLL